TIAIGVALLILTPPNITDSIFFSFAVSLSLSTAYLVANTAIETESPTQSLVLFLHEHRRTGVTEKMILQDFLRTRPFRDSRLNALIVDGIVEKHGDRFVFRSEAQWMVRFLEGYRKLIGCRRATG